MCPPDLKRGFLDVCIQEFWLLVPSKLTIGYLFRIASLSEYVSVPGKGLHFLLNLVVVVAIGPESVISLTMNLAMLRMEILDSLGYAISFILTFILKA